MKEFPKQLKDQFKVPNLIRQLRDSLRLPLPLTRKDAEVAAKPVSRSPGYAQNRKGR